MRENDNIQGYEECYSYAGDLEKETQDLMKEPKTAGVYTSNTPVLTIFCC